jgi:FMN phosphatase YigB (HAD superfamily)
MPKEKVKVLLFDLGGVIVDLDYQKTIKSFEAENKYNQFNQHHLFDDFETGRISAPNFIQKIQDEINQDITHEIITNAWNSMILGFQEEKLSRIENISQKIPCYLLSNTNEIHLNYVNNLLKNDMNYDGSDVLFIEDSPQHIEGAKKANINTLFYKKMSDLSKIEEWI